MIPFLAADAAPLGTGRYVARKGSRGRMAGMACTSFNVRGPLLSLGASSMGMGGGGVYGGDGK